MRILLTNDDGVGSGLLAALAMQLDALGDVDVIAPAADMTGVSRSLSLQGPIAVDEIALPNGRPAFAVVGTPVDCVRFGALGLAGGKPDVVISGPNYGVNLGDDVAYSGTVAAALEGVMLGLPAIAVSQQSRTGEMDFRLGHVFDFTTAAAFAARVVDQLDDVPLPEGTLLNINVPGGTPRGVEVARLGKRIYQDELLLVEEEDGRRRFRVYGDSPVHEDEPGTDLSAVSEGRIAVTPLHFDLLATQGIDDLRAYDLEALLAPAAEEVEE